MKQRKIQVSRFCGNSKGESILALSPEKFPKILRSHCTGSSNGALIVTLQYDKVSPEKFPKILRSHWKFQWRFDCDSTV